MLRLFKPNGVDHRLVPCEDVPTNDDRLSRISLDTQLLLGFVCLHRVCFVLQFELSTTRVDLDVIKFVVRTWQSLTCYINLASRRGYRGDENGGYAQNTFQLVH